MLPLLYFAIMVKNNTLRESIRLHRGKEEKGVWGNGVVNDGYYIRCGFHLHDAVEFQSSYVKVERDGRGKEDRVIYLVRV